MQIFYYMTSILDIKQKKNYLFMTNILNINIERVKNERRSTCGLYVGLIDRSRIKYA